MSTIKLTSKPEMLISVGGIHKTEVRCSCGVSCKNVATYLEHQRACKLHAGPANVKITSSISKPRPSKKSAGLPDSTSPPKPVACSCGRRFKTRRALQQHTSSSAAHKQQAELPSHTHLVAPRPATPPTPATQTRAVQDSHCPCGKTFPTARKLQHHLRYSKTHARSNGPSAKATAPRPSAVQMGPLPGTTPASLLSPAAMLRCTCGGTFETERVLALHRRDWHGRGGKTAARGETSDASLAASLAGLELESVEARVRRFVGAYYCLCGDGFASQAELARHRQIMGRCAVREGGGLKNRKFNTRRPAYQKDGYVEDGAMLQKLQYASAT